MRTFSPCWKALTVCTGVAKSTTSRRRRRLSGSEVLRNSMTMFCPWRRIGDGKARGRVLDRLLGGDTHHDVAPLLGDVESFDAVGLREGAAAREQPEGDYCAKVFKVFEHSHFLPSDICSVVLRSTQSPPLSWTTSFKLIWPSSMAVMTPKFWPM